MTPRNRLLALIAIPLGMFLLVTTVMAVSVGDVTHRFSGAPECIVLDPEAGEPIIHENVRPNEEFHISQFITNTCDRSIEIEVKLNAPEVHYIQVESDDLGFDTLSPGITVTAHGLVTFGNDTPAKFSAKDVVWKVSRPE